MQLLEWMRRHGVDDEQMAALINQGRPAAERCTAHAVKKWKYRERVPSAAMIARFEDVTRKRVKLRDWVEDPREKGAA